MLRHVARLGWGKIVFPAPDLSSVVHADVGRFWCLVGQDRLKMHDAAPTDVGPGVVVGGDPAQHARLPHAHHVANLEAATEVVLFARPADGPVGVGEGAAVVVSVNGSHGAIPPGAGVRGGGVRPGREGWLLGLGASGWCGGTCGCRCRCGRCRWPWRAPCGWWGWRCGRWRWWWLCRRGPAGACWAGRSWGWPWCCWPCGCGRCAAWLAAGW